MDAFVGLIVVILVNADVVVATSSAAVVVFVAFVTISLRCDYLSV